MHTEKREDPLVELGYEVRDLNTVAIRNAAIGFFIFAIGSAILGFICYRLMNPSVFEPGSSTPGRVIPAPPNPLLQSNIDTKTDIMGIRQHETSVLTAAPGWTDATHTHLHIPLDLAMQIIATKGVPKTGADVPAVSKGHTPNAEIGEKPVATPSIDLGKVPPPSAGAGPLTLTTNNSSGVTVPHVTNGSPKVNELRKPATAPPVSIPPKKKN